MKSKLLGIIKVIWYKLIYRNTFCCAGIPAFDCTAKVNLLNGKVSIGKHFRMKTNAYIAVMNAGKMKIGEGVSIARNSIVVCHDYIEIGDYCAIAPNVAIYDHDHKFGYNGLMPGYNTSPVIIEDNCWIGAGTIILRGSHIGKGCVIGAGSIVKGEVPAGSLVTTNRSMLIVPLVEKE